MSELRPKLRYSDNTLHTNADLHISGGSWETYTNRALVVEGGTFQMWRTR